MKYVIIILNLLLLGAFPPRQDETGVARAEWVLGKRMAFSIVVFLSLVLIIALYRISLVEGLIYLVLTLIIGKLMFGLFRE